MKPHAPEVQVVCAFATDGQTWPQLLQFRTSVASLTHAPLQSDSPEGQLLVHANAGDASAALHTGVPASSVHAPPQVPQLLVVLRGTHAPPAGLQTL